MLVGLGEDKDIPGHGFGLRSTCNAVDMDSLSRAGELSHRSVTRRLSCMRRNSDEIEAGWRHGAAGQTLGAVDHTSLQPPLPFPVRISLCATVRSLTP